jgi:hypothetical protein
MMPLGLRVGCNRHHTLAFCDAVPFRTQHCLHHAEQLLEMAIESAAMDAKDEAATLARHLAELEVRKLEMEAGLNSAKFSDQQPGRELLCIRRRIGSQSLG